MKKLKLNEIDDTIKSLNNRDRIYFKYKNVNISLKRNKNRLLIEPYSNKIIELLLRFLGFFLSMFISVFLLAYVAATLDVNGVGDGTYSNGFAYDTNWVDGLMLSTKGFGPLVYIIIFYFFGRIIRTKILNKLLYWKHKNTWDEFNLKYSKFRY